MGIEAANRTRRELIAQGLSACAGGWLPPLRASGPVQTLLPRHIAAVRERMLGATNSGEATGLAIAVTCKGRTAWQEGCGLADVSAGRPATERTPFCLASLSKPFTATSLMTLVLEGKLALSDSANRFLGDACLRGLGIDPRGATIRLLGAHAAGLPAMFQMYSVDLPAGPAANSSLLRGKGEVAYEPGRIYEYSNIGYAALGLIAERVSGQPFGTLMTDRILSPLGMKDSFFGMNHDRVLDSAVAYDELRRSIPRYSTATPASGEVYASARDLGRFALFHLKQVGPSPLFPGNQWIDELHRPVFSGPAGASSTFGWFRGTTEGGRYEVVTKDGGQPGVSTLMVLVPAMGVSCTVLSNRTDNGALVEELANSVLAAMLPGWTSARTIPTSPKTALNGASEFAGQWVGEIRDAIRALPLRLDIYDDGRGAMTLGAEGAEPITGLSRDGSGIVGQTATRIPYPMFTSKKPVTLKFKLLPRDGELVGRVLATAEEPGNLMTIPFVLRLRKELWQHALKRGLAG